MLVFDRGYCDYKWFAELDKKGVHCVTRLKENAAYEELEAQPAEGKNVTADKAVVLNQHTTANNETFSRVVQVWDEESKREFQFLTNNHASPAKTIAAIYKERWQVESFFKALKQNLRFKCFVGTCANALKTQIWTALIALPMVRFLQLKSKLNWHLSPFIALLRQQLFVYRDL